jgi:hypothetical protein
MTSTIFTGCYVIGLADRRVDDSGRVCTALRQITYLKRGSRLTNTQEGGYTFRYRKTEEKNSESVRLGLWIRYVYTNKSKSF